MANKLTELELDLIGTLEDTLALLQQDGTTHCGMGPDDESYISFESTMIYAMEHDIQTALNKAKGE